MSEITKLIVRQIKMIDNKERHRLHKISKYHNEQTNKIEKAQLDRQIRVAEHKRKMAEKAFAECPTP